MNQTASLFTMEEQGAFIFLAFVLCVMIIFASGMALWGKLKPGWENDWCCCMVMALIWRRWCKCPVAIRKWAKESLRESDDEEKVGTGAGLPEK